MGLRNVLPHHLRSCTNYFHENGKCIEEIDFCGPELSTTETQHDRCNQEEGFQFCVVFEIMELFVKKIFFGTVFSKLLITVKSTR